MFKHILIPLDGSPLAECVLPHAVAFARTFGATCTLVHVLEITSNGEQGRCPDPLEWQMRRQEAKRYLEQVARRLDALQVQAVPLLCEGRAANCILDCAHREEADLILLSSHGYSGLSGWNLSSVAQKVIVRANTGVMLIRAYRTGSAELDTLAYRKILAPLDGSRRAECALAPASSLARHFQAELLLAHVVRKPEVPRRTPLSPEEQELVDRLVALNRQAAQEYLESLRSHMGAGTKIQTRLAVASGVATYLHELVESEQVDLVVMCAHGYSGETRWPFGSIAASFILHGTTPLLFVQDLPRDQEILTQAEQAAVEQAPADRSFGAQGERQAGGPALAGDILQHLEMLS